MRNHKSPGIVCRRGLCVVLVLMLVLSLGACAGQKEEPLLVPSISGADTNSIETAYGPLAFPKALQEYLHHEEVTEGNVAMEIFSMVTEAGEKELFRIHFADAQAGTHMGYLTTENGEIPVSYSLCEYADEDFANEDERGLFYNMMDGFSVVLNSITADERFSETRAMEEVAEQDRKLRYWKVTLPENVLYTETDENGIYRADFYGEVSGERIDLYTIFVGNMESETVLGYYTVDGEQAPVVIETYDMDAYDIWPEEERIVIFEMMESLNTMVQTIVEDKNFTETNQGM